MTASRIFLDLPLNGPIMPRETLSSYIIFAGATKIAPVRRLPAGGITARERALIQRAGEGRCGSPDGARGHTIRVVGVGNPEHRRVGDLGMGNQQFLAFLGENIDAAAYYHEGRGFGEIQM